ncbi:MAG: arsenic metallochaperone ArsD family protein, partial [Paracoccus sp. (in: a-proteobacteria)]|nr:arsenic metallochaperone ArsD family protein [Paracoccus sp. (in: a-proteobacteria)]
GICGTEVDQKLVDLAADLDWLKAQGVSVRRFGLSREPAEFAANDTIREIMQDSQGDDLPVFLVDGVLKAKARYPTRAELSAWARLAAPKPEITAQVRELIALGAAVAANCRLCVERHVERSRQMGLSDAQMRDAIATGRMVREASERNFHDLLEKLIPEAEPDKASPCCGPEKTSAASAGCCGGSARVEPVKDGAGSCC